MTMDFVAIIKRSPFIFPLACIATAAMMFVSEGSYWQSVNATHDLARRQIARTQIVGLTQNIQDAEAGPRRYLLTNRAEYLEPYHRDSQQIDETFKRLGAHYRNDPVPAAVLARLQRLTIAKQAEMEKMIQLHQSGQVQAARELLMADLNKWEMETLRDVSASLLAAENDSIAASRTGLLQTMMLSRIGVATLSAISLLGLYFFLRQTATLRARELELNRLVQVDRDRLERVVRERTAELTELTQHLQTAREDERHRLARNLHDDLGSLLTSAKLDAARIKSRIATTAPEALELLTHLVATLNSSVALGRRIIEDLRPSALVNLGLLPTLEILAREFTTQSGVPVQTELEPVALQPGAELMVYRLVQEAFTNIVKYAQAQQVWLTLRAGDGNMEISVRDDGVGFDTDGRVAARYGLLGMRYRVQAEGGRLEVTSSPGQGTQVLGRLPLTP